MVRSGSDRSNLRGLDVEIVEADLTDPASLTAAVAGCGNLFHVAADYRLWVRDPEAMFVVNVEGTRSMLRAAADAGVERIVYTSSVAALGIVPGGAADEETQVSFADMVGPYKQSKFFAEDVARAFWRDEGLPVVIVNPSTPIGPCDIKPTPTGKMVKDAAEGRIPAFVDTGLNIVHVDDVAKGHLLAMKHGMPGQRYVLGGEDMTLAEILTLIAGMCGRKPPTVRLPHGAVMPVAYAAEAWSRLFGGEPFTTVDSVRMSRKRMFFSSAKATDALSYSARPAIEALRDALVYFGAIDATRDRHPELVRTLQLDETRL